MRRFVAKNKILAFFVLVCLLPVLLVAVSVSSSDLDDVAAMTTVAKKAANTVFILDTSETMNSFAYSDYIETCDDALHNADHAYDICKTSLEQCLEVKSEAGCVGGSIDCTNVANGCGNLLQSKSKLQHYCDRVNEVFDFLPGDHREDRTTTTAIAEYKQRFVGPWNPDDFYDDDICFYDWTEDSNGDVLNGTTSEHWSNQSCTTGSCVDDEGNYAPSKVGDYTTYNPYATKNGDRLDTTPFFNTDRSDWDCLTDGNDNMSNGQKLSQVAHSKGGVSGLWLNWKYTTSLDAIKILLADTHEFSYPPRTRGENKCFQYNYKPVKYETDKTKCAEEKYFIDNSNDGSGEAICKEDPETGVPYYAQQKTCFVNSFDTAFLDKGSEERKAYLTAMRQIIAGAWTAEKIGITDSNNCLAYSIENDFSFYDGNPVPPSLSGFDKGTVAPSPVSSDGCAKCMQFNNDAENPAFIKTECKKFVSTSSSSSTTGNFDPYEVKYHRKCCKTSKCTNPKCRDNDICCKEKNDTLYPAPVGDEKPSEGYKKCVEHGMTCELGFYSEFDQDMTHCCGSLDCVSAEEGTFKQDVDEPDCFICETGAEITSEEVTKSPKKVNILPEPENSEDKYSANVPLEIKLDTITGDENIEDMTVTLYYACKDTNKWVNAGGFTCYREGTMNDDDDEDGVASCSDLVNKTVISTTLSDCEDKGYDAKLVVSTTGRYCQNSDTNFSASFKYELTKGSLLGHEESREILDPTQDYYMILRNETDGSTSKVVQEYECKNAFYHTQAYADSESCPRDSYSIVQAFHRNGYNDVDYCDPASRRQEVVTDIDGWNVTITYVCTYFCRDEVTYDEPWKCMAWFYQLDEVDRNGLERCSSQCMGDSGMYMGSDGRLHNKTVECCKCINDNYHYPYTYFEPREGVVMPDPVTGQKTTYKCAVSGIMGGDTQVGWHAEIVNGHIREVDNVGSYLLSPYTVDVEVKDVEDPNGETTIEKAVFSPYEKSHWMEKNSYLYQKSKDLGLRDTKVSFFRTSRETESRKNVCIYDLIDDWGGSLCSMCSTCSFGCFDDPTMYISDDKCAYPSFWVKIPQSDGGEFLFGHKELLSGSDDVKEFKTKIRELKAVGGPTLGETLYDVWRYLGGMYAVYDPNHRLYKYDYAAKKWEEEDKDENGEYINKPYVSPYENLSAECFSNEVIIISGGQAQFDHNDKVTQIPNSPVTTCAKMDVKTTDTESICVERTEGEYQDNVNEHKPYYETDWYQSAIVNIANFVKTHSFANKKTDECVKTKNLGKNLLGYDESCAADIIGTGNNKTVINKIHTGAIGEWTLSTLYNKVDFEYLKRITKKNPESSEADPEDGKYCSLTIGGGASDSNCAFHNITQVLSELLTAPQNSDITSGRPHWTSSLVQPFDVEEKYRGPEAYVAGALPVESATSRFWFGNLKKYMVDDGDSSCGYTIACEKYPEDCGEGCGGWQKQKFTSDADCFVKDDFGTEMDYNPETDGKNGPDEDKISDPKDFRRLLAGGAAKKLSDKLRKNKCTERPCFRSIDDEDRRTIYYDNGKELRNIKNLTPGSSDMEKIVDLLNLEEGDDFRVAEQIFDYMYGYNSFALKEEDKMKLRFGYDESEIVDPIKVLDPIDIDFNHKTKVKIRPLLLGAIVHSKPVAVYYEEEKDGVLTLTTRIFAGANDGMLHAFYGDGTKAGEESWAYIPSKALPAINFIAYDKSDQILFHPSVDGPITLLHIDKSHDGIINGGEPAFLIFGYRRGAKGYTVIDVSKPDAPEFVQNIETGGKSFGKAVVFRKCNKPSCSYADQLDYYLAVPGGYDECADGDDQSKCRRPGATDSTGDVVYGNYFAIYHFDNNKFDLNNFYIYQRNPQGETDHNKKWLISSFAAKPFAINTKGKGAVDTEFVYFTDITGTVFRVDVRKEKMDDWTAKVVFAERGTANDSKGDIWLNGKNYVGNNFFPPLEKYNPGNDPERIPIPVLLGEASWPRYDEGKASMTVFYDTYPTEAGGEDEAFGGYVERDYQTVNLNNNNKFYEGKKGWRIDFPNSKNAEKAKGEKGITEPLLVYDVYGSRTSDDLGKSGYSLAWNTYIPKKSTECKNFGTSFNYERLVIDGSSILELGTLANANGELDLSQCNDVSSQGTSLATSVGVVATSNGYDLTFGAGADIYRKKEVAVKISSTRILKWYELY